MVMPFGKKPSGLGDGRKPRIVDFDALYQKVHRPVLESLGFEPVRADQDMGGIIVLEMLERLAVSDAVVVDVSIANANVYYELGVRHAMHRTHCALVAADWARPLFDAQQVPRAMYPLLSGAVTDHTAEKARAALEPALKPLLEGESPVYQALPGFPELDPKSPRAIQLKEELRALRAVCSKIHAVGAHVADDARRAAAEKLFAEVAPPGELNLRRGIWLSLMEVARDALGWQEALAWIERMPNYLRADPRVEEQRLLAVARTGDPFLAIGALEELIDQHGGSSERWGLLGGRYKELSRAARAEGKDTEAGKLLGKAIHAYELGMQADLNDFFPSRNLARLYRERGKARDRIKARDAGILAYQAAQRSRTLKLGNEWAEATLLGLAFELEDVGRAEELLDEARHELDNLAAWKLDTTLVDLRAKLAEMPDGETKAGLQAVYEELEELATN